jgi:hypothetical protein
VQAAPVVVELNLVGAQEVPPVVGPGSAFARLTFDDATKKLDFTMTISGITAEEVTAAHIHRGAQGVNGPIIHNLSTVGFTTIGGSVILSDADIADLKAGNLYVNAHSKTNPGGFARAQIHLTPDAAIQASLAATQAAWNRKDVNAFLNGFTTEGALNEFGEDTIELVRQLLPEFIGDPPISRIVANNIMSTGPNTATAIVDLYLGPLVERHQYQFLNVGGVWKINGGPIIDFPVPAGTATIPVRLQEFAFIFDRTATTGGNFAFRVTNAGQQFHELALAKIPANANLQELLASEEDVEGFEFIGAVFAAPGETTNMVFSQPLSAGRYAMVCFIPDERTGTPHAFLGMVSEFTIGAGGGGGGTVRPPSTGDGGLVGESSSKDALLIGGILSLLAGGAVALTTRRARTLA